MKVGKVAKAEIVHPFHPLFRLSFHGFEKVSVNVSLKFFPGLIA